MKKKNIVSLVLLCSLVLLLGACGKSLEPKKAAEVFMNRTIYNKDKEEFSKNFKNSKEQEKEISKFSETFSQGMLTGLSSSGIDSSDSKEKVDEISKVLLEKMQTETSYTVKNVEKTKDGAEVTYSIKGLDIVSVYSQMMDKMYTETISRPLIL